VDKESSHPGAPAVAMAPVQNKTKAQKKENPYLKAFLSWFGKELGKSPNSVKAYHWELSRFFNYLGQNDITIPECKRLHIRDFLTELNQDNSSHTRARTLFCIKTFFRFLYREGYIPSNPAETIDPPKQTQKVPKFLLANQFRKLIKELCLEAEKENDTQKKIQKIIYESEPGPDSFFILLRMLGLSMEEISSLSVSKINIRNKAISLHENKKILLDQKSSACVARFINNQELQKSFFEGNSRKKAFKNHISWLESNGATQEEATHGLESFRVNPAKRDLAIISLLLGTGIRRSELVGLNRQNYNEESKTIMVTRKGGDQQIVEVGDEVCVALSRYLGTRRDNLDPMFLSAKGKRLSNEGLWLITKKILGKFGLEGSTHTLRHTFVTELVRQGVPVAIVQSVVGHKSAQTTMRYTHIISSDRRNAISKIKLGIK